MLQHMADYFDSLDRARQFRIFASFSHGETKRQAIRKARRWIGRAAWLRESLGL